MILIRGWDSSYLGEYKDPHLVCTACDSEGYIRFECHGTYFSIFWVPVCSLGRRVISECENCGAVIKKNQPSSYLQSVEKLYEEFPIPIKHFSFSFFVFIVVFLASIAYISDPEKYHKEFGPKREVIVSDQQVNTGFYNRLGLGAYTLMFDTRPAISELKYYDIVIFDTQKLFGLQDNPCVYTGCTVPTIQTTIINFDEFVHTFQFNISDSFAYTFFSGGQFSLTPQQRDVYLDQGIVKGVGYLEFQDT